jgi:hypothetical protein
MGSDVALSRAWSVYLLINSGIAMDDERREILTRFIHARRKAGEADTEVLAVQSLKHLKELDHPGRRY